MNHLQHGMPVPDQAVSDVVFGPGFFDFKLEGKNKIDFGEVCILDTHTAWQIGQAHLSSDCEAVLRVLAGQCTCVIPWLDPVCLRDALAMSCTTQSTLGL